MKTKLWAGLAVIAAIAGSAEARAATVNFSYDQAGVTYALTLTVAPDPNTGVLPSTPPNSVDPVGAEIITGATGTFSDIRAHIFDATVTGVQALNPVKPETSNLLAPASFSLLTVKNGVHENGHVSPGFHYDNLYYAGGSPQTASDYPFSGGIFDIYGLVFTLDNGDFVNIWSNGDIPGVGLTYGVGVTNGTDVLGVPLPGTAPMFGAALLALGAIGFGLKRKGPAAA